MSEKSNGRRSASVRRGNNVSRSRAKFRRGGGHKGGAMKQYIHPDKFINKAKPATEEVYEPKNKFSDFPFSAQLQYNIKTKGFDTPSAIQDQTIPVILRGEDVIGLANTGTGKTAAFLLPLIERMSGIMVRPSVIVVAPTRELAQQIDDEFKYFAAGLDLHSTLLVGGVPVERQMRMIKKRPHFIIGTPGRVKDLLNRRLLNLKNISVLVLDEADRMLDMGFLPDIKNIVSYVPKYRQSLFFSATITPEIEKLTHELLNNPVTISVRTGETSGHVEQDVIHARDRSHKIELLEQLLAQDEYEKVLVFGETKYGVQRLSNHLTESGHSSVAIHGNKTQSQRQKALRDFKNQKAKVLVATDVAARGLDIPNVTHVINFDTPQTYEDYVHRIGRTGRGGARGRAHTFIEQDISTQA